MQEDYIQNSLLGISNDNIGVLFDYLDDGIIIIEQDGTVSYANENFAKQHNLKKDDIVGAYLLNLIPDEFKNQFRKIFREFNYSDKDTDHIEYSYFNSDNCTKWFSLSLTILRINNDKVNNIKILGILKEIEIIKKRETIASLSDTLLKSGTPDPVQIESVYFDFFSQFNFGIFIKHLSKKEIYINNKLVEIFGFTDRNTAKNKFNLFDYVVNDENYNSFLSDLNFNGGVCSNLKINLFREDSSIFSAILSIDFIRNQKGIPVYLQTTIIPFNETSEKQNNIFDQHFGSINELCILNELILILNDIKSDQFLSYLYAKSSEHGSDFAFFAINDTKSDLVMEYSDSLRNTGAFNIFNENFFKHIKNSAQPKNTFIQIILTEDYFTNPEDQNGLVNECLSILFLSSSENIQILLGFAHQEKSISFINLLEKYSANISIILKLLLLKNYNILYEDNIHPKKRLSHIIRNELELLAVSEISQLLTEIIDYELILQKSLEKISDLFDFDFGWVHLLNNSDNKFTLSSCYNIPDEINIVMDKTPIISTMMRDFIKSRDIFISNNLSIIQPYFESTSDQFSKLEESYSILLLPLKAKGVINGVMTFVAKMDLNITEWDRKILDSLSIIIGSALENSLLYADTLNKTIELEKRNKELNDFTHIVSHDLKNPINNILGISKILKSEYSGKLTPEINEFIEIIYDSSHKSQKLISDLLHFSRIGRVGEIIPQIDLNALVQNVLFDMSVLIKEKRVKVFFDSVLPIIDCDPLRIAEVYQNLITNSLKYNNKPEIIVNIGSIEKKDHYELYVKDNGIGINEKHYKDVFQIFRRIGESQEEGSGIGLAIVKKIIEFHQGKIYLESEKNVYTKFTFSLPRKISLINK
jgi:PAS domain S-box-containing protein